MGSGVMFAIIDVCLIKQVSVMALAKSLGVDDERKGDILVFDSER